MRSFTLEELERETGFERRTIAYYVQEGILPKVGRRGPRSRYPQLVMDRLLFIRRVREAEEAGRVRPVSLKELRVLFASAPPEVIAEVAQGRLPLDIALGGTDRQRHRRPAARRMAMDAAWSRMDASEAFSLAPPALERAKPDMGQTSDYRGASSLGPSAIEPGMTPSTSEHSMHMGGPAPDLEMRSSDPVHDLDALAPAPDRDSLDDTDLAVVLAEVQALARCGAERGSGSVESWSRVAISPEITLSVRGLRTEDVPLLEAVARKLRSML